MGLSHGIRGILSSAKTWNSGARVAEHAWMRSVPQRGSVGSAASIRIFLGWGMLTSTRRYRVAVLTSSKHEPEPILHGD